MKKIIIAIDGPAASGKSTTAKLVAERLNYLYIDTGAMYRAIAWCVLHEKIDPENEKVVAELAQKVSVKLEYDHNRSLKVYIDGHDVTLEIRRPNVTKAVSPVSSYPEVRKVLVAQQRVLGKDGGVVLDGRDIGTVVFPNAELKIFMVANARIRAERRAREFAEQGISIDLKTLEDEIIYRDKYDSLRVTSPLRKADDAIELDTSSRSIDEQVAFVLEKAKAILEK